MTPTRKRTIILDAETHRLIAQELGREVATTGETVTFSAVARRLIRAGLQAPPPPTITRGGNRRT